MKYKKKIKMKFKDTLPVPKLVPVSPDRDSKGRFVSKKKQVI